MLLTPTTPDSRVAVPTTHTKTSIPPNSALIFPNSFSVFHEPMAGSSSGWIRCRLARVLRTRFSSSDAGSSGTPVTENHPTRSPTLNARWNVANGMWMVELTRSPSSPPAGEWKWPTTRNHTPPMSIHLPTGSLPSNSSFTMTRPTTATLRSRSMSSWLMNRPPSITIGWISL